MLLSDSFVDDVVKDEIEGILARVDKEISLRHVRKVDVRLTGEVVMKKLRQLLNLALYSHDGSVHSHGMVAALEGIEPNAEPGWYRNSSTENPRIQICLYYFSNDFYRPLGSRNR